MAECGGGRGSFVTVVALAAALCGCKDANSPDAVASSFVDAYYIEFDLNRAKTLASGSALVRLEEEGALVDEARKRTAIQEAKARVYYEAPEKHVTNDSMVHFSYVLDIRRGTNSLKRPAVVMVAKRDGKWTVIQFREEGSTGGRHKGVATSTATP